MNNAHIRLACVNCDRTDMDGISKEQLVACQAVGWTDISHEQSYEQSMQTHDSFADTPSGFVVTAWYTHLGVCPECNADME